MPPLLKILLGIGIGYLALVVVIQLLTRGIDAPGIVDGQLAPVTGKPNCVSSETDAEAFFVEPLAMKDSLDETQAALLVALEELGGKVQLGEDYMHATFTSRLLRFVDDLECRIDEPTKIIHIRSASRLGYSDLGANRKRVEALHETYNK
ncbi:MAG: hypothetical protein ACI9TH_003302 [Kiritimatiellia bacterium]|jgi:uncharacterized protein (DUF1499 family)